MPRRKTNITAARGPAKSKRTQRAKRKNRKTAMGSSLSPYQKLVMDPCNGPLTRAPGFEMGVDVVERVRATYTFPRTIGNTCGYVAWFPSFHNAGAGAANSAGNLYCWEATAANISLQPLNTQADPMGSTEATCGRFLADPASGAIGSTGAFNRARTIAACMQLETLQQLSGIQGLVCTVAYMPLSSFNMSAGGSNTTFRPPSVQQVLNYAGTRERLSLEGHEVIWAPHERDSMLRTNGVEDDGVVFSATSGDPNCCFWQGTPTTNPTFAAYPDVNSVMGVVIAWNFVVGSALGYLQLNCVKAVELQLAPRNNIIEPKVSSAPGAASKTLLSEVTATLDEKFPDWKKHAVHGAMSAATKVAQAAWVNGNILGSARTGMRGSYLMDG